MKNAIIFSDRREENIIAFFAFKVDSASRLVNLVLYTTYNLIEIDTCTNLAALFPHFWEFSFALPRNRFYVARIIQKITPCHTCAAKVERRLRPRLKRMCIGTLLISFILSYWRRVLFILSETNDNTKIWGFSYIFHISVLSLVSKRINKQANVWAC